MGLRKQIQWLIVINLSCTTLLCFFAAEFDNNGVELWSMKDTTTYPTPSYVENTNYHNLFVIYPNPSDGIFTIKLMNSSFNYGNVTVYDQMGKQIKSHLLNSGEEYIKIDQLPKGIYLVKLQVDNTVSTRGVIVN